jgi:type I restriction enzyme S subunit
MRDGATPQKVRLWEVADLNPENLANNTSSGYSFTYVDLSSVSRGAIDWSLSQQMTFRSAPSRARRKARLGDCIFGTVRPSQQSHGSIDRDKDDIVVSTGFTVLRARTGRLDPRFLHHWLLSDLTLRQAENKAVGSNYPAVNEADVGQFTMILPPLDEQQRIAEILDALDNHAAVIGRLTGKQAAIKKGLLRSLSAAHFSDDKLEALRDISFLITSGSRGWAQYYSDDGALFVRIGNLTREHINLRHEDRIFVQPPKTSDGRRTALHSGDVLISITADLGIVGVVPPGLGEAYVNQHIALVRTSRSVNPRWVGHMLASESGQHQFRTANDAGAKAGLNLPAIGRIRVPLPERAVQDRVVEVLDEQDAMVRHCQDEKAKLELLKQGLMDDLLTGRVRVPVGEGQRG